MSEEVGLLSRSTDSQIDDEEKEHKTYNNVRRKSGSAPSFVWYSLLLGIAITSIAINIVQLWLWFQARQAAHACKLPLAGLELENEVDFGDRTAYGDVSDLDALDRLWTSIDTNPGIVALPLDDHLGTTDPFPWDTSKGLYVLNSFHSMHCLQGIYGFARTVQLGGNMTHKLGHIVHCLDVLRSEIMCTADDTPLTFRFQEIVQKERAPKRKCRDWNKLVEYVTENSACFRRHSEDDPRYDTLAEFMYCPPNSPYNAVIEKLTLEDTK